MSVVRHSVLTVLASIALLLSACSVPATQGSLRTYYRSSGEHPLGVQLDSTRDSGWSLLIDSHGCSAVGLPWTLSIGAAGPAGAVGHYTPLVSSAEVADPTDAEIWIDVAGDGSVTWGEGIPDWAPEDARSSCGPSD